MQKSVKNRLVKQNFSQRIAINKDISELAQIDLFKMLRKSLTSDIFIVDVLRRPNHVDENNVLKSEFIKYFEYYNNDQSLFNITKDNKLYINIDISISHYSKVRDIDWMKFISHLSENSGIQIFLFVII